jgi:hypothetical protein
MAALRFTTLVAVTLLVGPDALLGQESSDIAVGDKVRISAPEISPYRLVGILTETSEDTYVLSVEGRTEPMRLPLGSMQRVEVSRGKKSMSRTLGQVGALAGIATGAVLGYRENEDVDCTGNEDCRAYKRMTVFWGAMLSGAAGGILGRLVGLAIRLDRWEEVPLDELRIEPTLAAGGFGMSVSLRF